MHSRFLDVWHVFVFLCPAVGIYKLGRVWPHDRSSWHDRLGPQKQLPPGQAMTSNLINLFNFGLLEMS